MLLVKNHPMIKTLKNPIKTLKNPYVIHKLMSFLIQTGQFSKATLRKSFLSRPIIIFCIDRIIGKPRRIAPPCKKKTNSFHSLRKTINPVNDKICTMILRIKPVKAI